MVRTMIRLLRGALPRADVLARKVVHILGLKFGLEDLIFVKILHFATLSGDEVMVRTMIGRLLRRALPRGGVVPAREVVHCSNHPQSAAGRRTEMSRRFFSSSQR